MQTITIRKALNFVIRRDRLDTVSLDAADEEGQARPTEIPDESSSPEVEALKKETYEKICQAIESLSPRQREAVKLYLLEELSLKEIAQRRGISVGAVKAHLYQGLKNLRKKLEPIL